MPILSMFYGIIIRMYSETGERHHIPHIHCAYAGDEAVIDLEGNVIKGELPSKQTKLVQAWIVLHKDELDANWELLSNHEQPFKIKPLQ